MSDDRPNADPAPRPPHTRPVETALRDGSLEPVPAPVSATGNIWSVSIRFMLVAAATVVVIAGLKAASPIVNYFLLALAIAVTSAAPVAWLERRHLPRVLSVTLVTIALLVLISLITLLLTRSLAGFTAALPEYRAGLRENLGPLLDWLQSQNIKFERPTVIPDLNPSDIMGWVVGMLGNVGSLLSNALLVLITAIFMLLDGRGFQQRMQQVLRAPARSIGRVDEFVHTTRRYLAIKTGTSAVTGLAVGLWVWWLGLDYPIIWGILAFFANYVPNIGSILAAVPAVLLAIVEYNLWHALLVGLGYLLINFAIGYLLEPRVMGRGAGLPTSVVFISLIFWGWVLGPVGMVLAVPLTTTVKIALASHDDTRWIALLIGDPPPLRKKAGRAGPEPAIGQSVGGQPRAAS